MQRLWRWWQWWRRMHHRLCTIHSRILPTVAPAPRSSASASACTSSGASMACSFTKIHQLDGHAAFPPPLTTFPFLLRVASLTLWARGFVSLFGAGSISFLVKTLAIFLRPFLLFHHVVQWIVFRWHRLQLQVRHDARGHRSAFWGFWLAAESCCACLSCAACGVGSTGLWLAVFLCRSVLRVLVSAASSTLCSWVGAEWVTSVKKKHSLHFKKEDKMNRP